MLKHYMHFYLAVANYWPCCPQLFSWLINCFFAFLIMADSQVYDELFEEFIKPSQSTADKWSQATYSSQFVPFFNAPLSTTKSTLLQLPLIFVLLRNLFFCWNSQSPRRARNIFSISPLWIICKFTIKLVPLIKMAYKFLIIIVVFRKMLRSKQKVKAYKTKKWG